MNNINNVNMGIGQNYIHTPAIFLEKNLMVWNNHTMIQLSNISYISAEKVPAVAFPMIALLLVVAGLIMLMVGEMMLPGLVLGVLGGLWAYSWYKDNEKRNNGAILHIKMNSGNEFYFTFEDKKFLWVVSEKLQKILINGGTSEKVEINITNSVIRDSNVLNGMNANGN